jgi:hypothetical protein
MVLGFSDQNILMSFLSHNIPKWNKLAEKFSQENPEYMLNYSLTDLYRLYKLDIF